MGKEKCLGKGHGCEGGMGRERVMRGMVWEG